MSSDPLPSQRLQIKTVNLNYDSNTQKVELLALNYYKSQGYEGIISQNEIWWEILALLFWDVIFAKVDSAVKTSEGYIDINDSRFNQLFDWTLNTSGMPADFFTDEFVRNRGELIINRYKHLLNSSIETEITNSFSKNRNKNCRLIENWNRFTLDDLLFVVRSLNKETLIKICIILISDFVNNRSGLTDLFIVKDGIPTFVEIKSQKDKLSDVQIYWHKRLIILLNCNVELLLVDQSERQKASVLKKYADINRKVKISFGDSSSAKREEAINFFGNFPTFENKDDNYSVVLDFYDLDNVIKALDYTSRWKSTQIEVDGEVVKASSIRDSIFSLKRNNSMYSVEDLRYGFNRNDLISFFPITNNYWNDYGYIDTNTGNWFFDKKKLLSEVDDFVKQYKYDPFINIDKVVKDINKLPDFINPAVNTEWVYVDKDSYDWEYRNGKFVNWNDESIFPGFSSMISVRKKDSTNRGYTSKITIPVKVTYESKSTTKKKSGCNSSCIIWSIRVILFFLTYGISAVLEILFWIMVWIFKKNWIFKKKK